MQRKPIKYKVLIETAVATKTTDVLDILAKCEVHNQNIIGFMISSSPFGNGTDLEIILKGGSFINTVPFFKGNEFIIEARKLLPKNVIVQNYY